MLGKVTLTVPEELASTLVTTGQAELRDGHRASGWEVAITAATTASVVITLLQTPNTLRTFAKECLRLTGRRSDGENYLEANGRGGSLRLRVTRATSLQDIEKFLERTIFVEPKPEDEDEDEDE